MPVGIWVNDQVSVDSEQKGDKFDNLPLRGSVND